MSTLKIHSVSSRSHKFTFFLSNWSWLSKPHFTKHQYLVRTIKMQFKSLSFIALLFAAAQAGRRPTSMRSERAFSVTEYSTSYFEPQAVYFYRFDVSGPGDAGIGPAFSTSCNGSDTDPAYRVCNDPNVFANIRNQTAGDRSTQELVIERKFDLSSTTTLAAFGNVTIPKLPLGPKNFSVPVWLVGELGP